MGAGATGRVVAAVQEATGGKVAIKYLNPRFVRDKAFVERFRAEALLLAEIRHPNVVQLHEYVESDAGLAMVMELVAGPTLHRLLRETGPMAAEAALTVMRGSLLGLGAAHQMDIVHRDYKPSNVLLSADGVSKLADFGVAERTEPTGAADPDATMPAGVGTPAYMAPEQWDGAPARPVTDIYAVTASFFECLTGRVPYSADTVYELEEKHRTAPIPLAQVPTEVQRLIAQGLAKDPAERPQDVWTFVAEVERAATECYGVEWEERGRQDIVALWPMLSLFGSGGAGGGAGGLHVLGLGPLDPGGPGDPGTPGGGTQSGVDGPDRPEDGGGPGNSEPEDGDQHDDQGRQGRPRRRRPDKVKASAFAAGVAAIGLMIAAVAFAGDPKSTHQAGPPGATSTVFTPTAGGPAGTPTGNDSGAAPMSASSSSSSSSSNSSSSSGFGPRSGTSPSSPPLAKSPSKPSTSPISVPLPSTPTTSSLSPAPGTSTASTPSASVSSTPPLTIDARVSVASDPPGQCIADYDVVFVVGNPPGGSVAVDYSWHLANGSTVHEGPTTLKGGTSQTYTYREFSNGTTTGSVYVTWSANGSSGGSNNVSVTITCIK